MENIIIIGSSGHARVIIDIVEKQGQYNIIGMVDSFCPISQEIFGYKILGTEQALPQIMEEKKVSGGIIAIGDNFVRSKMYAKIHEIVPQFAFVTAMHPKANIARGVMIQGGTVVMAGVTINPCCRIGKCCILNTNASLDHDSMMADFSSLAPNAATGGNVTIGAFSAIGIGATLIHGIQIGEHSIIGAGATVLKNIESFSVAYGVPAKVVRTRQAGEKYL